MTKDILQVKQIKYYQFQQYIKNYLKKELHNIKRTEVQVLSNEETLITQMNYSLITRNIHATLMGKLIELMKLQMV